MIFDVVGVGCTAPFVGGPSIACATGAAGGTWTHYEKRREKARQAGLD
jgi:hypothetical protein